MARSSHRRQTLGQGLDKEVYQVVRRIVDERAQYGSDDRLSFAVVYDSIKGSNSSLNRKPKKLLEDSIERVLETIQQDLSDSDSDHIALATEAKREAAPNGMNRSIVGTWAVASGSSASTPLRSSTPKQDQVSEKPIMDPPNPTTLNRQRLVNGEPPAKKRKAASGPSIDHSPPTHVSLKDLGGVESVIQELGKLLVLPLTRPRLFTHNKIQPPRGLLIHGPPGCGKTMIANAVAAALDVSFISISAPSIVSGMSGESEKALREHFEEAVKWAPCLMFIDEIDAITPKRESAQREMEKRIVAQLLTCMDDLALDKTDGKPVIVLAATNRPDSLDPALRRAGRFDKEINMSVPNEPARASILRALTREMKIASDVDLTVLAKRTPGYVGADLSDLVSTASATALERYQRQLEATSQPNEMDIDADTPEEDIPAGVTAFFQLVRSAKESAMTAEDEDILVTLDDFTSALSRIQPSALREGFATIPSTTFGSIGALGSHITELTETVISPILYPETYSDLGLPSSSGTLLWGPPGCGKTLLAKACANSSHANFISVKGPELLNKYVGESERAVRQVFTRARSSVPVIIFFDELDALVPHRDGTSSEASARVVNTLLTELDGVGASREGIYVIAATNRPDMIDPAMLRPGRFDSLLYVGLPDAEGRVDILRTLCRRLKRFEFDDTVANIARSCDGFSGADLESLLRRAGTVAVRRCMPSKEITITSADFEAARAEVKRSVGPDDMVRYQTLQEQWSES